MPDKQTGASSGYSSEDEYFKKQELEFLNNKRAELDAQRQQATDAKPAGEHWMKCPKCGGDMNEIAMDSVMVDQCSACGGVYFDKGELEILIASRQSGGMLKKLFG